MLGQVGDAEQCMLVGHFVGRGVISLGQLDDADDEVFDLQVGARTQISLFVARVNGRCNTAK